MIFMRNLDSIILEIRKSCEKFEVKRLELFGSRARGDFRENSDVDFLVEFKNLHAPNISDKYFGLLEDLENLCQEKVDLVEATSVKNPFFKKSIDRCRVLIYGN